MPRIDRGVAFVTGANKGIGFEVARQLSERGLMVLVGARDTGRGQSAVELLRADGLDCHFIQIDVTQDSSVEAAARQIKINPGRLDVLVNNAGVLLEGDFDGPGGPEAAILPAPSKTPTDTLRLTYATNILGAVAVTNALLPLLRRSPAARIVNVSSRLARLSLADEFCTHGPGGERYLTLLAYNSSKAALNAATLQYAIELRDSGIKVNAADPGHCATDINGHLGDRSPADAARVVVRLATLADDGPTGKFIGTNGIEAW
jgi:NAD(P)-dependent dehydrogenase (short-subunit alcohol dehydrogenase family)